MMLEFEPKLIYLTSYTLKSVVNHLTKSLLATKSFTLNTCD